MSVLAWFDGKVGDEYETARWVHEQNTARIADGDALGLATQVAALFAVKGVFCGTMINGFVGKQEVLNDALEELRAIVGTMPDEVCEQVFAIIEKNYLPVHIWERRDRYEATKASRLEAMIAEIWHRLATCGAPELVRETATLVTSRSLPIFGLKLPGTVPIWGELLAAALERIRGLLTTLPDNEALELITAVRAHQIPRIESMAVERAINERSQAQWLAVDGADEPRNDALETAIANDPDDANSYVVLGDFLQRHGHPRGELIALQLRAETEPHLAAEAQALLDANAEALLGSLVANGANNPQLTWRRGYIDRIRISIEGYPPVALTGAQLLERALHHPAGRFIRGIELGIETPDNATSNALEILAKRPGIVSDVTVGCLRDHDDPTILRLVGAVDRLWSIPNLRTVTVFGDAELGTVRHDALETLTFEPLDMQRGACHAIARAQVPRLRELDLSLRTHDDPSHSQRAVEHLLARRDLPALTHLRLRDAAFTDEMCVALAKSPLAKNLLVLDVSGGTMTDDGARILATHLSYLDELIVSDNLLTNTGLEYLHSELDNVVDTGQRDAAGEDEDE